MLCRYQSAPAVVAGVIIIGVRGAVLRLPVALFPTATGPALCVLTPVAFMVTSPPISWGSAASLPEAWSSSPDRAVDIAGVLLLLSEEEETSRSLVTDPAERAGLALRLLAGLLHLELHLESPMTSSW